MIYMIYTIYKTTHIDSDRFYIGVHKTSRSNPNDNYLGSGSYIKNMIALYGRDRFHKEILYTFDNLEDALRCEKEEISKVLGTPLCVNVCEGGGLVDREAGLRGTKNGIKKATQRHLELMNSDKDYREKFSRNMSLSQKKRFSERSNKQVYDWRGKTHSKETKDKMSTSHKAISQGEMNNQYGTRWITNGTDNKKICGGDDIPVGWRLGRTCAFLYWIHKNGVSQKCKKIDIQRWVSDGWEIGREEC